MEELRPGGSCGIHSWIEGVSSDGRRVSWFAPQNQAGGRRLKTPSHGGTGVGLGTDGGDRRRRRLGPRCGRGGDGRRAASRATALEAGIFPRVVFWRFSQNRPPTRVSRTLQNRGPDLHQDGGIVDKTSFRRKNRSRQMGSCTGGYCRPTGLTGPWNRSDRSPRV